MNVSYYFKNIEPTEALKQFIADKLSKLDDRFHHVEGIDARMSVLRQNQIFELTIHADSTVFHIKKTDKDMYAAIDKNLNALQKQLDRHHKKMDDRMVEPQTIATAFTEPAEEEYETTLHVHSAVAKPMDDKEAILQLQAQKFRFLMYHHSGTKKYNLVFLRPDGNYSMICPTDEEGQYEERVLGLEKGELKTIAVSLYPMSALSAAEAVDKIRESQSDYMVFINDETRRMNMIFLSKNGELVLQRPAI